MKIVGTDPGISAELNGGTHMSMEDIGVVRSIPGMVIFEPVDEVQLRAAMPVLNAYEGPVYMRLFRKQLPTVFAEDYKFDLFKADTLKEGKDLTIFVSGFLTKDVLDASEQLAAEGIGSRKYFWPLTSAVEAYKGCPWADPSATPVAARMAAQVLTLPLSADLEPEQVERICALVRQALATSA